MTKLRLIPPDRFSSVPEIDRAAMNWAQLLIDQLQKWANGGIDGTNITVGSIPLSALTLAAWTTYTPTWAAGGGNPAIGNGTIIGRYIQVGSLVHVHVEVTAGSTTTFGTGFWTFTLPFNQAAFGYIGMVMCSDVSAGNFYPGFSFYNSANSVSLVTAATPGAQFTSGAPVAWANGDVIRFDHIFERT